MLHIMIVVAAMCLCGWLADRYKKYESLFTAVIIIIFALFLGLRTSYNDTSAYINSFMKTKPFDEFLKDSSSMNLLHNPLYHGFNSLLRGITDNYHVFLMVYALFDSFFLIRFLRNHNHGFFGYTILVFWVYGIGMLAAAAIKQITAMAILTIAFEALIKKKTLLFYLFVFIAGLIHTYAILAAVAPLFVSKPWSWKIVLVMMLTGFIILTFKTTISSIIDYAEDIGKNISEKEVFVGTGMNILRVAVYSIPVAMLFIFRNRLIPLMTDEEMLFSNMGIISFLFIILAAIDGANAFGRLSSYFSFGSICLFGWIIDKLYTKKSRMVIMAVSCFLFLIFIYYDNKGVYYQSIDLLEFIKTL